jgi:quinol monooxygenase YgiN
MNFTQRRIGYQCVFAIVAAAVLITPVRAQQGSISSVRFYTVKPDRTGDFLSAVKEYNSVAMKGGSTHYYSMWHSLTGANEYARVENYTKWADLDAGPDPKLKEQASQMQGIGTRITQCTESSHRIITEDMPDFSLPSGAEVPTMIRVLVTKVRPDKVNEYLALVKSDVFPLAKKAGVKGYSVAQTRYGGSSTDFVSITNLNNWADLDGGVWIQKAMGQEGYQHFLLKLRALITDSEATLYRFVPEASYIPSPTK